MVGKTFQFETVDLDGNKVTSDELFGNNEVTMINYWGTWCHFCVEEMPELAKINERLAAKNCGIIGIVDGAEADDQESLDDAKAVMMETGVKYPNVVPCDDMKEILGDVSSFPCSSFFAFCQNQQRVPVNARGGGRTTEPAGTQGAGL